MKLHVKLTAIAILVASIAILLLVTGNYPLAVQDKSRAASPGTSLYANTYFDVQGNDSVLSVPENGGSCGELVKLVGTHLNSSENLVLTAYVSGLSGYTVSFVPSSVTLDPGGSTTVELSITIPSGVPRGTYAVSIEAAGEHQIKGGTWIAVNVGSQKPVPPP